MPQKLAALAGLFALVLQALYAVPAAERMALGDALGHETVICLAKGGHATTNLPGTPGKTKAHCPVCYAAALSALGAVLWLLATLAEKRVIVKLRPAQIFLPRRLAGANSSRGPPLWN